MIPRYFDEMRPIEDLDLYSALYRLKHFSHPTVLTNILHWLEKASGAVTREMPFQGKSNPDIGFCLRLLIFDRVIQNQWLTKGNYWAHCKRVGEQACFENYVTWYIARSAYFGLRMVAAKSRRKSEVKPENPGSASKLVDDGTARTPAMEQGATAADRWAGRPWPEMPWRR